MKQKLTLIGIAVLAMITVPIMAQTNQMPNLMDTNQFTPFYTQVYEWASSYNTNLYWTNEWTLSTGVATTTGQKVGDRLKAGKNFGDFHAGAEADFIGAGSPIQKMEVDAGWAWVNKYDFQFGPELGGGYDFHKADAKGKQGAIVVDPKLFARKKLGQNWYLEATYGQPFCSVGKFDAMGEIYTGAGTTF